MLKLGMSWIKLELPRTERAGTSWNQLQQVGIAWNKLELNGINKS